MNNCSALQITDNRQQAECAVGVPADMDFINADLSDMGRRNTGIFPFKRPLLYFLDQLLSQMVFHCDGTNAHPMAFLDDSPFQFSGNSDVGRRQKMQMFKVATMAGLTIQSMNPDSEVDQMPPLRQALAITNANAFRSYLQRTTSRTEKILAFDDPNQFFFAIFESLVLKFTDFLCVLK